MLENINVALAFPLFLNIPLIATRANLIYIHLARNAV